MMERFHGVINVPLDYTAVNPNIHRVGVSLCFSRSSRSLVVPSANVIFFHGDRVEGTGNPVIERMSNLQNIAEILVSKFGHSINAWVIEASSFHGFSAIYKDFIPSVNKHGEPKSYNAIGFPASSSTVRLLSNCLQEAEKGISNFKSKPLIECSPDDDRTCGWPQSCVLGFSKGGTVLNQLVYELASMEAKPNTQVPHNRENFSKDEDDAEIQVIPVCKEDFLSSIKEMHFVDAGLNSAGAYVTDLKVIEDLCRRFPMESPGLRLALHGTPRQWCDCRRTLIREEKDKFLLLLRNEIARGHGRIQVSERFYFADLLPDLQMHFQIIENLDVALCPNFLRF